MFIVDENLSDNEDENSNTRSPETTEVIEELKDFEQEILPMFTISDDRLKLRVRRNYLMRDFVDVFRKKWNWESRNCHYDIEFVGEVGQDGGGVSREFYNGKMSS